MQMENLNEVDVLLAEIIIHIAYNSWYRFLHIFWIGAECHD